VGGPQAATAQLAVRAAASVCFDAKVGDGSLPSAGVAASLRLLVSPNPHGMQSPALHAIACPSTTECTAVGYGINHFNNLGFAEHYS
jgi:hypothetical protein